ncbi:MAG: sulfotransferase [Planctomycetota bacterium]
MVLGCGRSGTSMVAGCLHGAGYWLGDNLMPPTHGNPKGYMESRDVERINERLMEPMFPMRPSGPLGLLFPGRLGPGLRWLARVPLDATMHSTPDLDAQIAAQCTRPQFAFKDPRFCFTLPIWRPHVGDAAFIVIFREPGRTAQSIVSECRRDAYARHVRMTEAWATELWTLSYRHILEHHADRGDWLFVHFDQVLREDGLDRIEALLGTTVDRDFPEPALKRSEDLDGLPPEALRTYEQLCARAGFTP